MIDKWRGSAASFGPFVAIAPLPYNTYSRGVLTMDKIKLPGVAANHFSPEEKHLLAEYSLGLCSRPQALSPTVTERLYQGRRAFPQRCLRHSGCPAAGESNFGSRACGLSGCAELRAGWLFPGTFVERSGETTAPGVYPFSFNPRCKALQCSFRLSSLF